MSNIDIIVFGTFGSPIGFQQNSRGKNKYRTFDLNTNAIKIYPNSVLYSIRNEINVGPSVISYSIYSYAKEKNSDRSGTFIGSSLSFNNNIPSEIQILEVLNDFHRLLINDKNNIHESVIQVNSVNELKILINQKKLDLLTENQIPIEEISNNNSNKDLVVYVDNDFNTLNLLMSESIKLLNVYNTIYFTNSSEIAKFVQEKRIFKIVDIKGFNQVKENYIKHEEEEYQKRINNGLETLSNIKSDIEIHLQTFNSQLERTINDSEKKYIAQKSIVEQNRLKIEQAKIDKKKLNIEYTKLISETETSINNLSANQIKITDVPNIKNNLLSSFQKLKSTNIDVTISATTTYAQNIGNQHIDTNNQIQEKENNNLKTINENNSNWPFYCSILISVLLVVVVVFMYFKLEEKNDTIKYYQNEINFKEEEKEEETTKIENSHNELLENLSPKPNSQLNPKDLEKVNKKLNRNGTISIDSVVAFLFKGNPSDIAKKYGDQKNAYIKALRELNANSFINTKDNYYLLGELEFVPVYIDKNKK